MAPSRDDRPRPSNRSAYQTERPKEPSRRAAAASASYRSSLDKIFSGGGLPPELRARLGETAAPDPAKAQQKERCEAVLSASTPHALAEAAAALLKNGARDTASEPALVACLASEVVSDVELALECLERLVNGGTAKKLKVLRARLETLAVSSDVQRVRQRATSLVERLKKA